MLNMNPNRKLPGKQTGFMLLEGLIAILIFSMGILAIVGLQGASIKASSDAKYRASASLLANELIGEMWVSNRAPAAMQTNFQGGSGTDGANYTAWLARVEATLPGVAANVPTVTVNTTNSLVTINLYWKLPNEPQLSAPHHYIAIAQII